MVGATKTQQMKVFRAAEPPPIGPSYEDVAAGFELRSPSGHECLLEPGEEACKF